MIEHPKVRRYRVLFCDYDERRAFVSEEVDDAAQYLKKMDALRADGRTITCEALPSEDVAWVFESAAKYCEKHNLILADKPFV